MKFYEAAGITSKEIVVSCPSYMSYVERQAYIDACDIAGLKCIRLINESTAIALSYGFFRKPDLNDTTDRNVVFVDLGHSKLTVTFAKFRQSKMQIVCHHSDRNVGGRNVDYLLVEKFGEEFQQKFGCDPRKNVRTRLRMLDAIEKQRKILCGNKESTLNIECLMEDEDLYRNIKREEVEELMAPLIEKFKQTCLIALEKSGKYQRL